MLSRIAVVALALRNPWTQGDPQYYFEELTSGETLALGEYPAVAVWPLRALFFFSNGHEGLFIALFSIMCLSVDGLMFFLVQRYARSAGPKAFWIASGLLMPEVLLWRFDILPGVLVAMAALFGYRKRSAIFLATAAMMKLWPFALVPAIGGRLRSRATRIQITTFLATVAILSLLSIAFGGVQRLLSPLTYQGARGLQIESVAATPLMLGALISPERYRVEYAASKSFEITGPGDAAMQFLSSVLMLLCAALVLLWLWNVLREGITQELQVAWMILVLLVLLCANKVLSPQYLLWLAPLVVVGYLLQPYGKAKTLALLCLLCQACTTLVYPITYDHIDQVPFDGAFAPLMLALRNLLLVAMVVVAILHVRQQQQVFREKQLREVAA
ncbi:hypothetical protein CPPEL_05155 [Corynebacterium pseudopelargi]|uniref:DUF2029 domain-containing protein n=1 Tax=Corynebacterium pseudopelargi TaxID=2080757 RepID=A0A3G6ITS6_9CORY|nr:hypothetical protein CPPEL_05155 [Corynebacterium pseudopelargi]